MLPLVLGVVTLGFLMYALGAFSRAQIATIKRFGVWVAGLFGLMVALGLFFTGRLGTAIGLLAVLGPMLWSFRPHRPVAGPGRRPPPSTRATGPMSRAEAFEVLGLAPGADPASVQAAYVRLMQAAHPDRGGSDWLASRINQARDTLLG